MLNKAASGLRCCFFVFRSVLLSHTLPRVSGRVGVRGVGEISLAAGTPFRFRRARASAFRLRSA